MESVCRVAVLDLHFGKLTLAAVWEYWRVRAQGVGETIWERCSWLGPGGDYGGGEKGRGSSCILEAEQTGFERVLKGQGSQG